MSKANKLQIFNNNLFGEIRTLQIENKIHFVGKDVADALGYKESRKAINSHCKGGIKYPILTKGGEQEMIIIPESDLYRLIIKSKLPQAQEFEKWVMEEILPSIRKTGTYSINPLSNLDLSDVMDKLVKSMTEIVNKSIEEKMSTIQINNKVEEHTLNTEEIIKQLRAHGMTKKEAEYHAYRIRVEFKCNPEAINYILTEFFQRKLELERKKVSIDINYRIDNITHLKDFNRKDVWEVFDNTFYESEGILLSEELELEKKNNSKATRIDVLMKYKLVNKAKKTLDRIYEANVCDI